MTFRDARRGHHFVSNEASIHNTKETQFSSVSHFLITKLPVLRDSSMRQKRMVVLLLTACWLYPCCCAPVTLFMSRSYTSCTKYEWPKEVLQLLFKAYKPFAETYTEEQANNFVVNGLVHLERNMKADEVFDILGSDGNHISRSVVYGTDEALGPRYKTRWRWLPLIDGFDQEGKPLYHTSTWSDGTTIKSMDLLRLDYLSLMICDSFCLQP